MSSTSDDRHRNDQSAVPLFMREGRRMPRVALPELEAPPDVADMLIAG
jgi:hypothetical protein